MHRLAHHPTYPVTKAIAVGGDGHGGIGNDVIHLYWLEASIIEAGF